MYVIRTEGAPRTVAHLPDGVSAVPAGEPVEVFASLGQASELVGRFGAHDAVVYGGARVTLTAGQWLEAAEGREGPLPAVVFW